MNKIEKAQQVLADLNAQREKLVAKGHDLEERRQEISYGALTGSKAERKKLDEVNAEALTYEYELKSIDAAIAQATKRLAAADAAEAQAQDKDNAKGLRVVVDAFLSHAIALDDAFATVAKEGMALEETLKQIHSLGCAFPSRAQLDALGARALKTALMSTPWRREFEMMSPGQRQSFTALVSEWVDRIEANSISPRIGALKLEEVA